MRVALVLVPALALAGCGLRVTGPWTATGDGYSGSPLARATNGAVASFSFTACAPSGDRAININDLILQLNQQGILAQADGAGTTSRVVLNLCGSGGVPAVAAPTPAARSAR